MLTKPTSGQKPKRRRNKRRGGGGGGKPGNSEKTTVSASSRLSKRLGKNRRHREEWNMAVKTLVQTPWVKQQEKDKSTTCGNFSKMLEQFASVRMPCDSLELSECSEVAMRILTAYEKLSLNSSDQSFHIFCSFLCKICVDQQAPFNGVQLQFLIPFLLRRVNGGSSSSNNNNNNISKQHSIDAMRTLSKILLGNAERCTIMYGQLVEVLSKQITSEKVSNTLLLEEGDKTLRDCSMDCLSSLCLGASNTNSSKNILVDELRKGKFFVPLCIVVRTFVKKEDENGSNSATKGSKKYPSAINSSSSNKPSSAWAALDDDDEEDNDNDDEWESKSHTKHTTYDIVTLTSTCRALGGLIAALPSLGDNTSPETITIANQLIVDLHRLSSFGVDLSLKSSSVVRMNGGKLRSWRTRRSEKFSAKRSVGLDSDSESDVSDSGQSSASDTEASDAEGRAPIGQLCARLRLQALSCLQRISTNHSTSVHQKWTELIAENESEWEHLGSSSSSGNGSRNKKKFSRSLFANSKKTRSLLATAIFDPSSKVRTTAASVVCMMVESAPLNRWVGGGGGGGADKKNKKKKGPITPTRSSKSRRPAFISMTTRIANTIVALHGGLFFALRSERMSSVLKHLLRCAQMLFVRLPYHTMPDTAHERLTQFVPELVRIIRTALRPSLLNVAVATSALQALGCAFSTTSMVPSIQFLLGDRSSKDKKESDNRKKSSSSSSTATTTKTPPREGKSGNSSNPSYTPPHRRSGTMCSPVPVVFAPDVSETSKDVLTEILSLSHVEDGKTPLYNDLPFQGLTVLAKMAKRYPYVVLSRWASISFTILHAISNVEERVRSLGLNILTMLVQAMTEAVNGNVEESSSTDTSLTLILPKDDIVTFISRHLPRAFTDTKGNVRAAACGVLANVHEEQWATFDEKIRSLFFKEMMGMCNDKAPRVQMTGCLGVGRLASLFSFYTDSNLVTTAFTSLINILNNANLSQVVGAKASWAFANLCDVAGPIGKHSNRPLTECPLSLLRTASGRDSVIRTTEAAMIAASVPHATGNGIKMCSSAIRALGSIGQYWLKDVGDMIIEAGGDAGKWMELSETNPAIDMAAKVMETLLNCLKNYEHEKLLWNICHAVGRVMGSFSAYDVNDTFMSSIEGGRNDPTLMQGVFVSSSSSNTSSSNGTSGSQPHQCIVTGVASAWIVEMNWYTSLLQSLAHVASTCPNFKVRIHAVQALGRRCSGRKDYGSDEVLGDVLKYLIHSYNTMDNVMDPNMDYRFTLKEELKDLIMKLSFMIDPSVLSGNANGPLSKIFIEHCSLLYQLIFERDRSSGLSMIASDPNQLSDPDNISIVKEGIAVQRQYNQLAAQIAALRAVSVDTGDTVNETGSSLSKSSKSVTKKEWGDDSSSDDENDEQQSTIVEITKKKMKKQAAPVAVVTKKKKSAVSAIVNSKEDVLLSSCQKKCATRLNDLIALLNQNNIGVRDGEKEEKIEM